MNAFATGPLANPNGLRKTYAATILLGLVLAGGLACSSNTPTIAKDSASYKAGAATGVEWAQETMRGTSSGSAQKDAILGNTGPGSISDSEIVGTCPQKADYAQRDLVYYYSGGQIAGHDIERDNFLAGCIDGARAITGTGPK